MPGTLWSAPSSVQGAVSLTSVPSTIADISPSQCLIPAGTLNYGTRIRLRAAGEYTASTTASTMVLGFYMNQAGTAITTTPAILGVTAATLVVVATAWPFILEYTGVMQALSVIQNATTAKIVGQGWSLLPVTDVVHFTGPTPLPVTAALRTVAQTATGLNTETNQVVSLGCTISSTGFTGITVDELTCELIG